MHDPMTVAFEIKAPWFRRDKHFRSGRYHPPLVTIWHVDPEADGSDDSCDWFGRRLPEDAKKLAAEMATWDEQRPYLFGQRVSQAQEYDADETGPAFVITAIGPGDCLAIVLEVFRVAAWRLHRRELSYRDMRAAMHVAVSGVDNFQSSLVPESEDKEAVLARIVGCYLRERRPWWRHPRWHFWHWKIQVHAVQALKRWAFSRCCHCGGRFRWGESVVGYQWESSGPRWFRCEPRIAHTRCDRSSRPAVQRVA